MKKNLQACIEFMYHPAISKGGIMLTYPEYPDIPHQWRSITGEYKALKSKKEVKNL